MYKGTWQLEKAFLWPSTSRTNRYKLDIALIVIGVFSAPDNNVGIDIDTLSIIDKLDIFFYYLWDKVQYNSLLREFKDSWIRKFRQAKAEKVISYTIYGFSISK